ncbi:MAG: fluoride efflux transporter CrcB [Spirochaetaceae bacterium]|jgi:CrcB protein|nr:fluoride efflux transporter CrcB [Spirochaetaceae bacterium]
MKYICVIAGGGIGAVLRYATAQGIQSVWSKPFPLGTLFVNTAGASLIGFFFTLFETFAVPAGLRLFVITGFLGGYTTFSTYSLETLRLFTEGNVKQGLLNALLNNGICVLCTLLGITIGKLFSAK